MTIKTTRWTLDTCECIIEYTWDDSTSESTRTHTLDNYITKCPAHSILATDTDRWNTILSENPRKGGSLQICMDNVSTLTTINEDGQVVLKPTIKFNFSWTGTAPNRVLNISFSGIALSDSIKNNLQTLIDNKFGVGKVVLS